MARENYLLGATIAERLEFYSMPEPNSGCKLWLGRSSVRDYGRLKVDGKNVLAHRLAYEQRYGQLECGQNVLHRCDNPACINPAHLFVGSQVDNVADMVAKGRHRPPNNKGTRHGNAKLTDEDIRRIRSDARSATSIGRAYGVNPSTICGIKARKGWAHVR